MRNDSVYIGELTVIQHKVSTMTPGRHLGFQRLPLLGEAPEEAEVKEAHWSR